MGTIKLTPEKKKEIINLVRKGNDIKTIHRKIRLSRETIFDARRLSEMFPDFVDSPLGLCTFLSRKIEKDPSLMDNKAIRSAYNRYVKGNKKSTKEGQKRQPGILEPSSILSGTYKKKQRTCLKCGKLFTSDWAGNRICRLHDKEIITVMSYNNTECIY